MKEKKHLSFTALRKMTSEKVNGWFDPRREGSVTHTLHDVVMSGLACMYFQEPSLLQFQTELEDEVHSNNLRTLFGVRSIPSSNAMKDTLDQQPSEQFNPILKGTVQRLQRSKQLNQFKLFADWSLCSIDATLYYNSKKCHCKKCLTKEKGGTITYQHYAIQAALMHPGCKQVLPLYAESIQNGDGNKKQDCEINAAKRLLPQLHSLYPRMNLIITGDDLFSRQPMIRATRELGYHYFFVAKPSSHTYMMSWLEAYESLPALHEINDKGQQIIHEWVNDIPLYDGDDAVRVNYFRKIVITFDGLGQEKMRSTGSWVTDMRVTATNVKLFVRGAKCRWKVENECFNTLKNQGYHLTHNYGHGENHLSFNFYLLTVLAFLFHQVAELCDIAYQACRKKAGSKRSLWEKLRTYINLAVFESHEQLLRFYVDRDRYNIIDGFVVERTPP